MLVNNMNIAALVSQWVVSDKTTSGSANGTSWDDFPIATLVGQWVVSDKAAAGWAANGTSWDDFTIATIAA